MFGNVRNQLSGLLGIRDLETSCTKLTPKQIKSLVIYSNKSDIHTTRNKYNNYDTRAKYLIIPTIN